MRRSARWLTLMALLAMTLVPQAAVAGTPPNILAIWGDDIGWFNLSIHNFGIMGYQTPNLDKLGGKGPGAWGGMFTDAYAEQSCTAGRAAFLTGQHGLRSGMIKVGLPGVDFGLHQDDATIAGILKHQYGYTTGQFGKNHLGDTNEYLPTNRGFDEFFGNLYHLNAEEEPEHPDYPGEAILPGGGTFQDAFGPRGVIHSFAKTMGPGAPPSTDHVGPENDQASGYKWGPAEGQEIYNTGPLTRERMKTIDGAFAREAIRFMVEAQLDEDVQSKPFFVWYAASRMHVWTHLKEEGYTGDATVKAFDLKCYGPESISNNFLDDVCNLSADGDYTAEGKTGYGIHPDGMVEHDMYVGQLLDFIEDNGLKSNTIVMYTSDNGPESFSWPDGGTTPFRSEKATNWEGGYRVPMLLHWPGVIDPGFVSNEIIALQDFFPTLVNAVGDAINGAGTTDIAADLKTGTTIPNPYGDTPTTDKYKVHLDGYDFNDYLGCVGDLDSACALSCSGTVPDASCAGPRKEFIYANDDGVVVGVRYNDWKIVFHEQREESFQVWQEPFTALRFPKLMNLRSDPFEKADHDSSYYDDYRADRMFALAPAQVAVYRFLQTFKEFPPRQAPPSFTVDVDVKDIIDACGTAEVPNPNSATECFPSQGKGAADAQSLGLPNAGFGG